MSCMKEPFRSEGAAKEAIRKIQQRKKHQAARKSKRFSAAHESRAYKCHECVTDHGKPIWHIASAAGSGRIWKG